MKSLKKILIYLFSAIYLISSVSGTPVYAGGLEESVRLQGPAAPVEKENSTDDPSPKAADVVHGQYVIDGNNEMTVSLVDNEVQWVTHGDEQLAVRKVDNVDINKEDTKLLVQYKIEINLDRKEYVNYQKDGVCITIPKTIFRSYSSYTSANPTLSVETGNGVYNIDGLFSVSSGFRYEVVGDHIKIYNRGVLQSRTIEITLSYQPQKSSYYYPDYNPSTDETLAACASLPFDVNLSLTSSTGSSATLEAQAPCVYLDTNAMIESVTKEYHNSWKDVVTENGEEVSYLYVQFEVIAHIKSEVYKKPTQAYTFNILDEYSGRGDVTYDNNSNKDFDWQLVGWANYNYTNAGSYSPSSYYYSSTPLTSSSITRYVLFRIRQPETMYADYELDNKATVTISPRWGVDEETNDYDTDIYQDGWHNTDPRGRYFVHNWGNRNWTSSAHQRNTPNGLVQYNKHHWENANRELDRFANQQDDIYGVPVTELRGLRFWSWYEGYPSLGQSTVNKVKFVCQNKDLSYDKSSDISESPTNTASTNDYCLSEIGFYVEAKYATHNGTYWVVDKTVDPFKDDCEPIYLYCLVDGKTDSDWKLIATINYNATAKKWNDITINPEMADNVASYAYTQFEGENHYYSGSDTGISIQFGNQNVYGYRIENVNKHFYFFVGVRANYSLKSNDTTRAKAKQNGYYLFIHNWADMDIYDWNYPENTGDSVNPVKLEAADDTRAEEDEIHPGDRVFRFSETNSKVDRAATDTTAGENNHLNAEKTLLETEQQPELNRFRARWKLEGWSYVYGSVSIAAEYYPVRRIPMKKAVFYDVLPRGAVLEDMENLKNSIKVYKNPLWTNDYVEDSQKGWDRQYLIKNAPMAAEIDDMFLMDPSDYEVELIDASTWHGESTNGLMILIVTINKQSDPYKGHLPGTSATLHDLSGGYTIVFDTYTPYSVLAAGNKRIVNTFCFEAKNGFAYKEAAYKDNPLLGVRDKDTNPLADLETSLYPDYNTILKLMTNVDPNDDTYQYSYDYDHTYASYDTVASSGPSKLVAGDDGELVMDLEVEPGGTYTYYLRYATSPESTARKLVFYDKLEQFSNAEVGPSEWQGTLEAISAVNNSSAVIPATFYISDVEDADQYELTDSSVWTVVTDSTDLSQAVWVAADFGDYEVQPLEVAFVKLQMRAPTSNETNSVKPETYNNYRVSGELKDGPGGEFTEIYNVTNYTTVKYTLKGKIQIEKVNDEGRPISNVTFTLTGTSKFGDTVNKTVRTDADGKAVIEDIDISGAEGYTLKETVPAGYTTDKTTWNVVINTDGSSTIDGVDATTAYYRIVNHRAIEVIARKVWDDNDNQDGIRPASVVFTLYANGVEVSSITLDGTRDDNGEAEPWIAVWKGLPEKDANGVISYTIKETSDVGIDYEVIYDNDPDATYTVTKGTVTNKHVPNTVDVSVLKVWDDDDDRDGVRPDSVEFTLYANGTKVSSITLDGSVDTTGEYEAWKASWRKLPEKENGTPIKYTVQETSDLGVDYIVIYDNDTEATYTGDGGQIINRHIPAPIDISVIKVWDDNNDQDGVRPESVTFTLYADDVEVSSITLDGTIDTVGEFEEWKATWKALNKYRDGGTEIKYTVKETSSDVNYTVIYGDHEETFAVDGGIITNKHVPGKVSVSVLKVWDDNDDQDGVRPDSITFTLYADGTEVSSITLDGTVDTTGEFEEWKATWKDLDEKKDGKVINYTVKETSDLGADYTVIYDNDTEATYTGDGGQIINKHIPAPTEVSVIKAWDDNDDQDGVRPKSVTFTLYADGKEVSSITLDGTVDENGEFEAWKATWKALDKYRDGGTEIKYTVKETSSDVNYTVIYGDHEETFAVDGGTITNKHIPAPTEVSVIKAWDDNDDQDGVRPESVTFTLYADGKEVSSITLDGTVDESGELEEWKATWKALDKYSAGKEIQYTVKETSSDVNYTVIYGDHEETFAVDGGTITNKHITEKTEVSVIKVWDDSDDKDGIRPESVTFTLYADGKEVGSITLDGKTDENGEAEAWKATWEDLDKYSAGKEIQYTVKETSNAVDYTVIYDDNTEATYTVDGGKITNKHDTELIDIIVKKIWIDGDNKEKKRPVSIIVHLFADGVEIATVTITEEDGWTHTFKDLDKKKDGKDIVYTITEDKVADYSEYIEGFVITNTYDGPPTGDTSRIFLHSVIMAVSLAGFATTLFFIKKKEEEEE